MPCVSERAPLLQLDRLRISYMLRGGEINVTPELSLALDHGEALGLVGESGSGKSTVAFAILRHLGPLGRIVGGRILFEGRDLASLDEAELRAVRGRRIAMVYQDPMSSLNPLMTVGRQLMEVPMLHQKVGAEAARAQAIAMLADVNFADPAAIMARYPHQLSGGQQQRIVIAMALIGEPALLIMDEPTTGLDVTVEAAVLDLVRQLRRRHRTALLFISHNLGTVAQLCDRIAILYGGELVEEGPVRDVFANPRHPYTRGLLECLPRLGHNKRELPLRPIPGQALPPLARPQGCGFAPRCAHAEAGRCRTQPIPLAPLSTAPAHRVACVKAEELGHWQPLLAAAGPVEAASQRPILVATRALSKQYRQRGAALGRRARPVHALSAVDLQVGRGETLAIVGESGCGKSTFARVLSGLEVASAGSVRLAGEEVARRPIEARPAALKRRLQMVFQNPDSTLNPSHRVGYAVARALRRLGGLDGEAVERGVERLLEIVKLPPEIAGRMPHQLSGGQKQRVAIARALAGDPEVMLADEPVSSLDVSVQAAIINLLSELQGARAATLIFISHDLAVVRYIADHVAVMYLGKVVEYGPTEAVFAPPYHPYTEALLSAVPEPDPERPHGRIILEGSLPSASDPPPGCPFASRCPRKLGALCDTTPPPEQSGADGHRIACHIPVEDLVRLNAAGPPAPGVAAIEAQAIRP
jgi:peptide/nickel transport system ATP-binding protein